MSKKVNKKANRDLYPKQPSHVHGLNIPKVPSKRPNG
jgi:hypothetical protein